MVDRASGAARFWYKPITILFWAWRERTCKKTLSTPRQSHKAQHSRYSKAYMGMVLIFNIRVCDI